MSAVCPGAGCLRDDRGKLELPIPLEVPLLCLAGTALAWGRQRCCGSLLHWASAVKFLWAAGEVGASPWNMVSTQRCQG